MKFVVSIALIALLSVAACLYLPWWTIAFVAFLVTALIPQSPGKSFLTGFIALFILWGLMTWYISSNNNHILAHKVSILIFKMNSAAALVAVTALIGSLVGGVGALAGCYFRKS